MVIDTRGFEKLKKAFEIAQRKVLLYDIMTERFEINTIFSGTFDDTGNIR